MKRVEYFYLEESSIEGKYFVKINFANMPNMSTYGSFNLLAARVMGLTYANYLRFCRDVVGAELMGKNSAYPLAYFRNDIRTRQFVRLLNSRMNLIMWEREHPNWREHKEYLEEKNKEKGHVFEQGNS